MESVTDWALKLKGFREWGEICRGRLTVLGASSIQGLGSEFQMSTLLEAI